MDLEQKCDYVYPFDSCLSYPHLSTYQNEEIFHTLLPENVQLALKHAGAQAMKLRDAKNHPTEAGTRVIQTAIDWAMSECPEKFRKEGKDPILYRGYRDMLRGERAGAPFRKYEHSIWYKEQHNHNL